MKLNKTERNDLIVEAEEKRRIQSIERVSWENEMKHLKGQLTSIRQCCLCRKRGVVNYPNDDIRFVIVRWIKANRFVLGGYVCENHRYELEKDYQLIYRNQFKRSK